MGFYVYCSQPLQLPLQGKLPTDDRIYIHAGWNLISLTLNAQIPVDELTSKCKLNPPDGWVLCLAYLLDGDARCITLVCQKGRYPETFWKHIDAVLTEIKTFMNW